LTAITAGFVYPSKSASDHAASAAWCRRWSSPISRCVCCGHLASPIVPVTMPIESPYSPITVPKVDVWSYFLERSDREYPDDHGEFMDTAFQSLLTSPQYYSWTSPPTESLRSNKSVQQASYLARHYKNDGNGVKEMYWLPCRRTRSISSP